MQFDNLQFTPATCPNEAWMVDSMALDFAERPFVRLVADVASRRPLSATLTLQVDHDLHTGLDRLVRRSGPPDQIWFDKQYEFCLGGTLNFWAHEHRISIVYVPMQMPSLKSVSEPILHNLGSHLRENHFSTLMELGHEIERWRQSYRAERPISSINQ
ncbi:hypothetical protein IVB02_18915 [Bradyrhizobium sp. 166]|uniref:hypothetical protein n=1 Tax=Bradyrhizobium sp. 166 TaxID=2782638 RepID=UPI001FF86EB3|nr:hypothetical protein [Bradyrhizobium sp. 166]MCK1603456.1 hypothetical protein [Bradyrhizobium sp. 166]